MPCLNNIKNFFQDDYFTFSRKVVGLDKEILEKPIEEGEVKYINLLTTPMKIQDRRNFKISSIKPTLILESRLSHVLRLASFVTLIFPIIGLFFCLLNKQKTKVSPNLKTDWSKRFVEGNATAFTLEIHQFLRHAVKSNINPLIFKEKSFLLTGRIYIAQADITSFYKESHDASGSEACNKPEKTLRVPRKERIHFKYHGTYMDARTPHAVYPPELRGSVMVFAPYHPLDKKFPKALELYLKYLEKKQKS